VIGLGLGKLLDTSMEVADYGGGLDNYFSFKFKDYPEHPVGRRVLGAHVDG
jgi:hypothetical protein